MMRNRSFARLAGLGLVAAMALAASVRAEVIVDEKFDKPELAKEWVVSKSSLGKAGVATYVVEANRLVVTGLTQVDSDQPGEAYPTLAFTRKLAKPVGGDFDAKVTVGWSSKGAADEFAPIQYVRLRLLDVEGKAIAMAGYTDGHVGGPGRREGKIGETAKIDETGGQPTEGEGLVEIQRRGQKIVVFWNGIEYMTGSSATPVAKVEIQAQGYWWSKETRNLFNRVWVGRVGFETP